jgi:hypothetical protein
MSLMDLISTTLSSEYCESLTPVFSSKSDGHFAVTATSAYTVGGRIVKCSCVKPRFSYQKKGLSQGRLGYRIVCHSCDLETSYTTAGDRGIAEEDKGVISRIPGTEIYCAPWPIPVADLEWKKNVPDAYGPQVSTGTARRISQLHQVHCPSPNSPDSSKRTRRNSDPLSHHGKYKDTEGATTKRAQKKLKNCKFLTSFPSLVLTTSRISPTQL